MTNHTEAVTRTAALIQAFGWQGGTIHQLAQETGVSVEDLLYTPFKADVANNANDISAGWFASRTCTVEHNIAKVFPKYRGNVSFWHGVIRGLQLKAEGI